MDQFSKQPSVQYARDLVIIHANESALNLVGLDLEQARGISIQQFWNTIIDQKAHSKYLLDVMNNNAFNQTLGNIDCHPTSIFTSAGKIDVVLVEYAFLNEKKDF